MTARLELRLGITPRPHTRALLDGSVQADGVHLVFEDVGRRQRNAGTERHRAIVAGDLDGGEFSTSSLFLARQRGIGLIALPIFLARGHSHRSMYCYEAAPIQTPSDLRGKRVTVHRYNNTVAVWMRALLAGEYGVRAREIHWYVGEDEVEGEPTPRDVTLHRIPEPASPQQIAELLSRGELDAGLEAYLQPGPGIRRIVEDFRRAEADYYRRRGVLPIYHTLTLQASLLRQHPWLAQSLLDAFRAARKLAPTYSSEAEREEAAWEATVFDEDPFAYRLGACEQRTLETLGRLLLAEGLLAHPIAPETLFACAG
jgi:4,5-dihydroxyphthalate decarboxylase